MSRLRKSAAVICMTSGLVLAGAVGIHSFAAEEAESVALNEFNGSGISGSVEYGSSVTGSATGMDPSKSYYSFVYGAGSDSTGANPCILTGETLAGPVNTVGEWEVDEDGNGTLSADAPIPAERAGTMSIREDDLGTGGNIGPTPLDTLVACGDVGPDQRTPLGEVQNRVPQLPSGDDPLMTGGGDVTDTRGLLDGVTELDADDSSSDDDTSSSDSTSDDENEEDTEN